MEQNTFIVSPMNQFISLTPGETYSGVITVANPSGTSTDITYSASVAPYSVVGQDYTADLTTMSNYSQIVDWTELPTPTGTLVPNTTADIPFTITVPDNAPAGGQYITIIISQRASDAADSTISSSVGISSIIYADIAGTTIHEGEVLDITLPGFSFTTPVSISTLITNTGNVHESAIIELSVINSFTGEKIFPKSSDASSTGTFSEVIMPESTRLIVRELSNLPALGAVDVTQTVTYNGTTTTTSHHLVLCPIWFLALIILTITSIIFTLVFRARSRRRAKVVLGR